MSWITRIFMALLGLGLLAGLLLALGVYTVFATLRWLLTGRKPQVVLVWQQFGALRRGAGMRWGQHGHGGVEPQGDVVDDEVREVPEREDPVRVRRLPNDQA